MVSFLGSGLLFGTQGETVLAQFSGHLCHIRLAEMETEKETSILTHASSGGKAPKMGVNLVTRKMSQMVPSKNRHPHTHFGGCFRLLCFHLLERRPPQVQWLRRGIEVAEAAAAAGGNAGARRVASVGSGRFPFGLPSRHRKWFLGVPLRVGLLREANGHRKHACHGHRTRCQDDSLEGFAEVAKAVAVAVPRPGSDSDRLFGEEHERRMSSEEATWGMGP